MTRNSICHTEVAIHRTSKPGLLYLTTLAGKSFHNSTEHKTHYIKIWEILQILKQTLHLQYISFANIHTKSFNISRGGLTINWAPRENGYGALLLPNLNQLSFTDTTYNGHSLSHIGYQLNTILHINKAHFPKKSKV